MQPLIHLHILASGSKGNAALVEGPDGIVLVDCGISRKQLLLRAAELDVDLARLKAAFFTHEHGDHIRGLPVFAKRFSGPLYATSGTIGGSSSLAGLSFVRLKREDKISVAGMRVHTFPTSHDVNDPFGLHFTVEDSDGGTLDSVGWCTDTGFLTEVALKELRGCRVLGIEANHDVHMLATGPYPSYLKARVGGKYGHLSNEQAAEALPQLVTSETTTIVALHISEKNNLPSVARKTLQTAAPDDVEILVAGQNRPMTVW